MKKVNNRERKHREKEEGTRTDRKRRNRSLYIDETLC